MQTKITEHGFESVVSALKLSCQWLGYRTKPIYPVMVGVGAAVSVAGLCISLIEAVRESLSPGGMLLAVGLICFFIATAINAVDFHARIRELRADLVHKSGYKHFVDNASEGFFRITLDGQIIETNQAAAHIWGYQSGDELSAALNSNFQSFYIETRRREEFLSQLWDQGRVEDFISKVRRRDSKTIWVSENARAVHCPDGAFLYCEGTVRDVTASREAVRATRKALEEARENGRAKAAFVAAMSHELKTPLNAVLGFSDLILQEPAGQISDRYRSYIADIHSNGKRLLELVGDVIDFARIEGHALELNESVFSIEQVIESARVAVLQVRPVAPTIVVKTASRMPQMRGDPKRMTQAITNILSNAVKFTPADGCVLVTANRGPDGGFALEIADSGIGMPPERIATALEPFRQIDERLSRKFEGLGLGLPIAGAIIRLHGGHLAISSTLNKGTVVNIAFPPERRAQGVTR